MGRPDSSIAYLKDAGTRHGEQRGHGGGGSGGDE